MFAVKSGWWVSGMSMWKRSRQPATSGAVMPTCVVCLSMDLCIRVVIDLVLSVSGRASRLLW
eukprot:3823603-Rhodomonas_salina.1